ncbi:MULTISPECIES: hypothetical protein [Pseudomonas]|uniref:Uncharacterized protein n=1 Tax=Pseudomonas fluorescens TaxID=294 RepID=A0A5E6V5J5_PSEFL|nr:MULTISPECIES: hypothetical protein [Pseudomonas]VVN07906.1 hypothetical protein PS652_03654 [Pseudomonas fluorescens]
MPTHRQQSFIAQLETASHPINFLGELVGSPVKVALVRSGGGAFSGAIQYRDDSHFLGHQAPDNQAMVPLTLYFRHTPEGYKLYVRSPGPQHGKRLGVNQTGLLGAFPVESCPPSTFSLLNPNGRPISHEHLNNLRLPIRLKLNNGSLTHRRTIHDSKQIYLGTKGGAPLEITLNILELNAPYLSEPNEI